MIALGRKDGAPIGIHPLVSVVARPVKHVRLVTALLKAATLMLHKAHHVPLHGGGRKSARCARAVGGMPSGRGADRAIGRIGRGAGQQCR